MSSVIEPVYVDLNEVSHLFNTVQCGQYVTYHTGCVSIDVGPDEASKRSEENNNLREVSSFLWNKAMAGQCHLFQVREGTRGSNHFRYVFVKDDPIRVRAMEKYFANHPFERRGQVGSA